MGNKKSTPVPQPVSQLAESLIELLSREKAIVENMGETMTQQLIAIRSQNREGVEEATLATSREISQLMALQMDRNKQIETLTKAMGDFTNLQRLEDLAEHLMSNPATKESGEKILELHNTLKHTANATRERGRELTYTLQYAMHLGHSLLETVQTMSGAASVELYTAAGKREKTRPSRSFVNQIG